MMWSALQWAGILLAIAFSMSPTGAQQLPAVACPEYFEYLSFNGEFIGHIALRHDPLYETNNLRVEFSQYGAYDWSYVGSLSLLDDQETTKENIRNGRPINYRVDFPIPGNPPKLTRIMLNSVELCSASQYGRPRTAISLMHTLHSTVPLAFLPTSNFPSGQTFEQPQIVQNPVPSRRPVQRPVPQTRPVQAPPSQLQFTNRVEPQPSPNETSQPANPGQLNAICGRERVTSTPLIFQGRTLERGQLPWLVGLFERNRDLSLIFFCGGTLISSSTVISAAHCFRHPGRDLPASNAVVSLGRNTIDLISDGELRDVSQLLIHEQYKPSEYTQADLVLLRLATQVTFNNYIVPICLWNSNYPLQLPSGYRTYVAGWGADELGNANTKVSKITDTNFVTESNCLRELPPRLVQSNSICAKKVGAGPCGSDGGGGLMLRENDLWLLRGVIAGGQRNGSTCDLTKPSVYTDVAKHIAWVRQNMWD